MGKELFARHGRNKLLTEHGIQLLGYARKILRFNDEACTSLMFSNLQGYSLLALLMSPPILFCRSCLIV